MHNYFRPRLLIGITPILLPQMRLRLLNRLVTLDFSSQILVKFMASHGCRGGRGVELSYQAKINMYWNLELRVVPRHPSHHPWICHWTKLNFSISAMKQITFIASGSRCMHRWSISVDHAHKITRVPWPLKAWKKTVANVSVAQGKCYQRSSVH